MQTSCYLTWSKAIFTCNVWNLIAEEFVSANVIRCSPDIYPILQLDDPIYQLIRSQFRSSGSPSDGQSRRLETRKRGSLATHTKPTNPSSICSTWSLYVMICNRFCMIQYMFRCVWWSLVDRWFHVLNYECHRSCVVTYKNFKAHALWP